MIEVTYEVRGLRECEAALDELSDRVARRAYGQALRAAAQPVAAEVRNNVLRRLRRWSGDLLDSIKVRLVRPPGATDYQMQAAQVVAGSKRAFYAYWLEFGTKAHTITGSRGKDVHFGGYLRIGNTGQFREQVRVGGIDPGTFMRDAADKTLGPDGIAIRAFEQDLRQELVGVEAEAQRFSGGGGL